MLSLSAGIVADRWILFRVSSEVWLVGAIAAGLVWAFLARARWGYAWLALLAAFFCTGAARHHEHWRYYADRDVATLELGAGRAVAARCRILTVPEPSPLPDVDPLSALPQGVESKFYVEVTQLRNRQHWEAASGRVITRVDGHMLGYSVGDTIEAYGQLSPISGPMNPGERDRRLSERNRRTVCRLDVPHPDCIHSLERNRNSPLSVLGRVRSAGLTLLDRYVEPPHAELAGALLLGARDRLGNERVEVFFHTGTIHLLAISGLHVGILAWGFFFLAKRSSSRRLILVLLMFLTFMYCHLTGLRAPVLRAAVLIQVICLSQFWRREVSAFNALAAAALLILFYRPGALFLPGAQLSFLAVATLIWLGNHEVPWSPRPIERLVLDSRSALRRGCTAVWRNMRTLAFAGCAIWVVTLPLVMHWFHLCSPITLALNVLLTVPITIGLLSGLFVLITGTTASPLAALCGWICSANLALVEAVVQFGHALPGAYFWTCGPSPAWCGTFYAVLCGLLMNPLIRFNKRIAVTWFALWLTLPQLAELSPNWISPETPQLQCTFLSVGHGTCAVLEMPDGRVLIYDAGRMGVPAFGVSIVSEFLWSRNISHVDAILMSHADADHYNLVPGLIDRFSIGEVLVTSRMFGSPNASVAALRDAIVRAGIPIRELQTNDVLRFSAASARVLHPLAQGVNGSDNANSIVLEIQFQGRKILLPGDLESPGMDDVLAEMPRDMDLAMAPHHGSLRSHPAAFTAWAAPEFVVISGGRDEHDAQVIEAFQGNGAKVLHTAYDGAITAKICDRQLTVTSFRAR